MKTGDADDYGVNAWLEEVRQREWLETLPSLDEGIRIHDAPKAGVMMDRAHERLAKLEQREQDSIRKTDPAFAGCFVQLLGGYGYDEVGLVIDDRKAEQALSAVVAGTDYEPAVRLFRGDEFLEMVREFHRSHWLSSIAPRCSKSLLRTASASTTGQPGRDCSRRRLVVAHSQRGLGSSASSSVTKPPSTPMCQCRCTRAISMSTGVSSDGGYQNGRWSAGHRQWRFTK